MVGWYPCCCDEDESGCSCCSGTTPTTASVQISGTSGGAGGICTNFDGTYVLDLQLLVNCAYRYEAWIYAPFRLKAIVSVAISCAGSDTLIDVQLMAQDAIGSKTTTWIWRKTVSGKPVDCAAERTGFTEVSVTAGIFGHACDTTFPTMVYN